MDGIADFLSGCLRWLTIARPENDATLELQAAVEKARCSARGRSRSFRIRLIRFLAGEPHITSQKTDAARRLPNGLPRILQDLETARMLDALRVLEEPWRGIYLWHRIGRVDRHELAEAYGLDEEELHLALAHARLLLADHLVACPA